MPSTCYRINPHLLVCIDNTNNQLLNLFYEQFISYINRIHFCRSKIVVYFFVFILLILPFIVEKMLD